MICARWAVVRTVDGKVTRDDIGLGVGMAAVVGEGEMDYQLHAWRWEAVVDKKVASDLEKVDQKGVKARMVTLEPPEVSKIS